MGVEASWAELTSPELWALTVFPFPSPTWTAHTFYTQQVGFRLDHDTHVGDATRVVQLTPPREDGGAFLRFSDPDGNGWAVQEIRGVA